MEKGAGRSGMKNREQETFLLASPQFHPTPRKTFLLYPSANVPSEQTNKESCKLIKI